ncbi:sugar ABC transporter ATPase [Microbacterium sp. NPDC055910]|uniref:sugar ABC transporter ATPase n=1 Tax=Microbacterium sp. NPDC055910 TaxID=3345659 RepID=UPI0035D8C354
MNSTPDAPQEDFQPLGDRDSSIEADPAEDPAQAEWDGTTGIDAERPVDDTEIPASDLPDAAAQPETQGTDPVAAELGEEGQGDLAPEDL